MFEVAFGLAGGMLIAAAVIVFWPIVWRIAVGVAAIAALLTLT